MGLCRQRHKPGHPAGEIEGSWAIDKESGERLNHITKKALPDYEKSALVARCGSLVACSTSHCGL